MSDATTRLLVATVAILTLSGSQFVGDAVNISYAATRIGELRTLELIDGSVITLNTDSAIKTRTDGASLHVEVLRGEVLFATQPNSMGHLSVSAGDLDIFDTATVFDVRLSGDGQVRVTVQEGEVRLSARRPGQLLPLEHNQQAIHDEQLGTLKLRKGLSSRSIEYQLSWREGRLIFGCERLSEVAREFNRYNLTKLEVDPRIENEQIGGNFSATNVAEFVELMPHLDASIRWERAQDARGAPVLRLYQAANPTRRAGWYAPCNL
jgi:transmembrane sensor